VAQVDPAGEPEEEIEAVRMPFADALEQVRAGGITDAKTAVALLLASARQAH